MKRIISFILCFLTILSFYGCAGSIIPYNETLPGNDTSAQTQINSDNNYTTVQVISDGTDSIIASESITANVDLNSTEETSAIIQDSISLVFLDENGSYTTKEDVSLYIHQYGKLPSNFITKKQAESLGWVGGSLEAYAPGKCIGGNRFGNYEGLLPDAPGRSYTECDIDTLGKSSRGAKRIVFSNDGLIYYTGDHYQTFELLYGGD